MADSGFLTINEGNMIPGKTPFSFSDNQLQKFCQPCSKEDKKTAAENWCVDCSEFLCSLCSKTHTRFIIAKDHTIVLAAEARNVTADFDMTGIDQCRDHDKPELLKFVCTDDDELCCHTCAIAKHRHCDRVVEIEKYAKAKGSDLINIEKDLIEINSKAQNYAQLLIVIRESVTTEPTKINDKIQKMQDEVNAMFENLKMNIAKETRSFQQRALHDLRRKQNMCNNYITDLTKAISDINNVRHQGTPAQQLIMAHHFKTQVMTFKEKTDKDISELKDIKMSFDFDQSMQLPPANNFIPGNLTIKYVNTDLIGSCDSKVNQHKDHELIPTMIASIELTRGDSEVENPLYTGLAFLPDGRLIAVDNLNKKCLVYNQKLEKVGSGLLPAIPYDVTVMTDEEVAVSSGPEIYFIKIDNSNEVIVTQIVDMKLKCESISMIKDYTFLVGCYNDPQPVRVVSLGEKNIYFPAKRYTVGDSVCKYISNCKKVVLSDRLANTVFIYDTINKTRVEVKDEKIIQEPRGVAVGPADSIFVCSWLTHAIVQVSYTGHILSRMFWTYCIHIMSAYQMIERCLPYSVVQWKRGDFNCIKFNFYFILLCLRTFPTLFTSHLYDFCYM